MGQAPRQHYIKVELSAGFISLPDKHKRQGSVRFGITSQVERTKKKL